MGDPVLASTHRGDYHLTIGLPEMLRCYEQAIDLPLLMQRVVVDREGMAAEFLAQLTLEGRQVVTLLKADQYKDEQSFQQVGEWQPWRFNRHGQMICEVAAARFAGTAAQRRYLSVRGRGRGFPVTGASSPWLKKLVKPPMARLG